MREFSGKKVYITGGSAGIGRALALDLARRGAHVYVGARGQAGLDETVAACRAAAPSKDQTFGAVSVDVSDRDSVRAAAAAVLDGLGGLDLLVCNAGFAITGYLHELPDEAFDQMIGVNYLGHVNTVRAFLDHFRAQRAGHICLVSSVMGFVGFVGYGAYSPSKHAIVGFGHCLRNELMPLGVEVSLYYPTTTDTPGLERENETKPPETWALEGTSKPSTAEDAAADLLRHVASGRYEGMRFVDPWYMWLVQRFAPGIIRYFVDSDVRKAIGKQDPAKPGLMPPSGAGGGGGAG